eukprot:1149196-Pelagomonas_calceolata.AAC.2
MASSSTSNANSPSTPCAGSSSMPRLRPRHATSSSTPRHVFVHATPSSTPRAGLSTRLFLRGAGVWVKALDGSSGYSCLVRVAISWTAPFGSVDVDVVGNAPSVILEGRKWK